MQTTKSDEPHISVASTQALELTDEFLIELAIANRIRIRSDAGAIKLCRAAIAANQALFRPEASLSSSQPCQEDLALWKRGYERYEKARKLNPIQWAALHQRNLGGEFFDDMIDAL